MQCAECYTPSYTNHALLGPLRRADGLRARRHLARHASEERVHAGLVGTQPCSEGGVLGALRMEVGEHGEGAPVDEWRDDEEDEVDQPLRRGVWSAAGVGACAACARACRGQGGCRGRGSEGAGGAGVAGGADLRHAARKAAHPTEALQLDCHLHVRRGRRVQSEDPERRCITEVQGRGAGPRCRAEVQGSGCGAEAPARQPRCAAPTQLA